MSACQALWGSCAAALAALMLRLSLCADYLAGEYSHRGVKSDKNIATRTHSFLRAYTLPSRHILHMELQED